MFNWASLTDPTLPAGFEPRTPARADARMSRAVATATNKLVASFDNARTTDENRRNWWSVNFMSAKAANSFAVRRTLRLRSRDEVCNNPYLFGIVNGNADDLVSTGPTVQIQTTDAKYNRAVEACWNEWAAEVDLVEKLRTLKLAKTVDGEGFLVLRTVKDLEHPVKLYPCDLEADQVTTPLPTNMMEMLVDGLTLHPVTGRPTHYHVLRYHPGDFWIPDANPLAVDKYPAEYVIHWFGKWRPGQVRGVPVFASSLDLFAELRAFRKAVLTAAQTSANLTALLESSAPATDDEEDDDDENNPFPRAPIERGMMMQLPAGMTAKPFDVKHPSTTYDGYMKACICEAIRPLSYPLNLALGSSKDFNFSSSKLDIVNYRSSLSIERSDCDRTALNRIFAIWYPEAVLCGAVPAYDGIKSPPHAWHWPGFEPLDPLVDANADHERRAHGTLTDREYWAKRGFDYRDVYRQLAEEQKEREALDLVFGEPLQRTESEIADADAEVANVA